MGRNLFSKSPQAERAFSLAELLVVLSLFLLLLTLSVPSLLSLRSLSDRKAALSLVLSRFELARVRALEEGVSTYVGFLAEEAEGEFEVFQNRAFILFRERKAEEPALPAYYPLSPWQLLPKGMAFEREAKESLLNVGNSQKKIFSGIYGPGKPESFPLLYYVKFTPQGIITEIGSSFLALFLKNRKGTIQEKIELDSLTGRVFSQDTSH